MSDAPLMNKMDALLKKHRGSGEQAFATTESPMSAQPPRGEADAPPPHAWLPVLTDVIEHGTPPAPATDAREPAAPAAPAEAAVAATPITDTLAEQLMSELAPRLSEVMEKQVAAELRKNLDQTVSTLLAQLDVNVREIVREAVAEKLKSPRDPTN
ncbi:MAG: hypothetical protein ACLGG6_08185 [Gammaproteobacteria bacterium]